MLAVGEAQAQPGPSAAQTLLMASARAAANQMLTVILAFHLSSLKQALFSYFFWFAKTGTKAGLS